MWQLITGKGENHFHFSLPTVAAGKTPASFDSFLHRLMRHGEKKINKKSKSKLCIYHKGGETMTKSSFYPNKWNDQELPSSDH